MRKDRVGGLVAVSALLAVLSGQAAWGQAFETHSDGLSAGRFIWYPSVTFEATSDSNVLYASSDLPKDQVLSSEILVVRPRILVELPLGENRLRWVYTALYRDYTSDRYQQSQHVSQFFDMEGTMKVGSAMKIALRDHVVRDTLQLAEADKGGEVFTPSPFITQEPEMEIDVDTGGRQSISLLPRYIEVRFGHEGDPAFFKYRTRSLEARYNYRLTEASTLYGYYQFEDTHQNREQTILRDVTVASRSEGIGLRRSLSSTTEATLSAGYTTMVFAGGNGRDFAGPVVDLTAQWQLSDVSHLNLSLGRHPFQSYFANNNYYVNDQVSLRLVRQVGRSAYWQGGVNYSANVYADRINVFVTPTTPPGQDTDNNGLIDSFESLFPSQGVRRRDEAIRLEAGVGYQMRPTVRLFLGYNAERRRSNIDQVVSNEVIDPFGYRIHRILFRIEAGWW